MVVRTHQRMPICNVNSLISFWGKAPDGPELYPVKDIRRNNKTRRFDSCFPRLFNFHVIIVDMKVYRFEHHVYGFGPLCGEGCRQTRRCWDQLFRHHDSVDMFPCYDAFLPRGITDEHFFGMSSLEGLLDICFEGTVSELADCGFFIYVYEVMNSVEFPDGQVVFMKKDIRFIHQCLKPEDVNRRYDNTVTFSVSFDSQTYTNQASVVQPDRATVF